MSVPPLVQSLLMTAIPSGGQRAARRNAWAGMVADAARSRAQREADLALAAAHEIAAARAGARRTGT